MFYLISDDKHFYCVKRRELNVTDPGLVKVSDEVSFNYGSKSYTGLVIYLSGKYSSTSLGTRITRFIFIH